MRARGISWVDLGLRRPERLGRSLMASVAILGLALASIIAFEKAKEMVPFGLAPDTSSEGAVSKFGDLRGD